MFLGSTKPEQEVGFIKSGGKFISRKRRKTENGQPAPSLFEESEHELQSQVDKCSCDEEEDYSMI